MMFCGVDTLETVNEESKKELENPKDPRKEREKVVTKFILQKAEETYAKENVRKEKIEIKNKEDVMMNQFMRQL